HIVDVTVPSAIGAGSFLGTIGTATLTTAPAEIAGGRVDALAVVDSIYLVCVAVGASDANGNSITVFDLPTVQVILGGGPPFDFSTALFPTTVPAGILATGNADGKAGGVSGANATFLVATGGSALGVGVIDPATRMWTPGTPVTATVPPVDHWLDVAVTGTNGYASVDSGGSFGVLALTLLPAPALAAGNLLPVTGAFGTLGGDPIAGPGNFALDLAVDGNTLLVSGDDEVVSFDISSPAAPVPGVPATATGLDTIAVAAQGGDLAVGAGDAVRIYQRPFGPPTLTAEFGFTSPITIRGVALRPAPGGNFVLCCGGTRGLRVVQWSGA
ncbi:MAG: hypothetical protein ACE5JG_00740, partial [Planctomycetota bacterium]